MLNQKSQAPLEFMILTGILFFLLFLLILHQLSGAKDVSRQKESELVYDLALKLQEEIKTASLVEDGYFRDFTIPSKLDNFDYALAVSNGFLTVQTGNSIYTTRIPNITGTINKGANSIKKSGGVVYINQ